MKSNLKYVVIILISIFIPQTLVLGVSNAIQQYVPKNCRAIVNGGYISYTNPNLNTNGSGVYHRVALTTSTSANPNAPASQFAEIGWIKYYNIFGFLRTDVLTSYSRSNNPAAQNFSSMPSQNPSRYVVQYDPNIYFEWFFFVNGQIVSRDNGAANFQRGCAVVAGGEVVNNVESMGFTDFTQLSWAKLKPNGQIVASPWEDNTIRLHQNGYLCLVISLTSHRCYHQTFG